MMPDKEEIFAGMNVIEDAVFSHFYRHPVEECEKTEYVMLSEYEGKEYKVYFMFSYQEMEELKARDREGNWDGYSYYDEGHLPWDFEHVDRIEAITNVLESEGGMGNEEVTLASSCGDGRHR